MAASVQALLLRKTASVLPELAAVGSSLVGLSPQSGISLLPVTEHLRHALPRRTSGDEIVYGFYELTSAVASWARHLSRHTPVAYVHFEFHGGNGFHAAIGWASGEVAWGPRFTRTDDGEAEDHYELVPPPGEMAVNGALRWLGVHRHRANDEFQEAGLTRFRWTEQWERAAAAR